VLNNIRAPAVYTSLVKGVRYNMYIMKQSMLYNKRRRQVDQR